MKKMFFITSLLTMHTFAHVVVADVNPERQNELLYFVKHDCGSCHGMTLKGGLGPALLPQTLSVQPKSYLVDTILQGRKNTAMPAWKSILTIDEASWIVDQLKHGTILPTQVAGSKQKKKIMSNP